MIEFVIQFLNAQLEVLKLFTEKKGLVEQVSEGDVIFPAEYKAKGEFKPINIDSHKAMSYFRVSGPVTREILDDDESPIGGQTYEARTYPLKMFVAVPKSIFKTDNPYIVHKIGANLFKHLSSVNHAVFTTQLPTANISIQATSYDFNPETVLAEEYQGVDVKYDSTILYIGMDLNVVIEATQECWFTWDCEDTNLVISPVSYNSGTEESDIIEKVPIEFDPESKADFLGP